jgi:hypothetical protein
MADESAQHQGAADKKDSPLAESEEKLKVNINQELQPGISRFFAAFTSGTSSLLAVLPLWPPPASDSIAAEGGGGQNVTDHDR